jgi:flagellar protein FlgJ
MSQIPQLALPPAAQSALAADPRKAALVGKSRASAEEFEAVFLNTMFQQMFGNVGNGPFNGGQGAGMWRSFLTDEYAKTFSKAGGIGIADHVQRALLAQQEIR